MRILFTRALLFSLVVLCLAAASFAQIGLAITIAPPPLPVYEQPLCPGDGYIWTPGYWAYDYDYNDYYWVPGTWVMAPEVGFLWTPAYWGWGGDRFVFHDGYWGPRIGFYGGINYGFGYFGEGYEGGRWDHDHFFYNRSVTNINITEIHNVYNTTVVNNRVSYVSYNGGNGGIDRRPRPEEEVAARERHIAPVEMQTRHAQEARNNPQQRASENRGRPPVAATSRPGAYTDHAIGARLAGAPYTSPANRGADRGRAQNGTENNVPRPPVHARDLPPPVRLGAPNTGNPKRDQKYQQQQDRTFAKQQQEQDRLQRKQEQEHQRLQQQHASEARQQQVEQRHQQQTQQLQQRHEQQVQHLQQTQQPPNRSKPRR